MRRILKNALKLVTTGTLSLLIAACYGVPMAFKRITALSPVGVGIRDLNVSLIEGGEESMSGTTDAEGTVVFSVPDILADPRVVTKAVITDVDGTENGGPYADAEVEIGDADDYTVTMELK